MRAFLGIIMVPFFVIGIVIGVPIFGIMSGIGFTCRHFSTAAEAYAKGAKDGKSTL